MAGNSMSNIINKFKDKGKWAFGTDYEKVEHVTRMEGNKRPSLSERNLRAREKTVCGSGQRKLG